MPYIHIIDGQPGIYDGFQVCYGGWGQHGHKIPIVPTLRQIKKEQRLTIKNRKAEGYPVNDVEFSWAKVVL